MSDKTTAFYNNSLTKKFENLKPIDAHEVLKLEEEIEGVREQIESFKKLLHHSNSLTKDFENLKLIDVREVLKLEEEIEILREQIESFKKLLHQRPQKMQEITQELMPTNQKLRHCNQFAVTNS